MTHTDIAGRTLSIHLGDPQAPMYSPVVPGGAHVVGTVARAGKGVGGALAYIPATGLYVQINAGVVRNLPPEVYDLMASHASGIA